jgi:hypothetical protein
MWDHDRGPLFTRVRGDFGIEEHCRFSIKAINEEISFRDIKHVLEICKSKSRLAYIYFDITIVR